MQIKLLKREAEAIGTLSSTTREADLYISGDGAELSALPPRPPRARSLDGRATFDNITAGDNVDGHRVSHGNTRRKTLLVYFMGEAAQSMVDTILM